VKVSLVRGGGFGGFVTRTEIDGDQLPPERAEELRVKVAEAEAGEALEAAAPSGLPSHPDEFQYELTIEDAGETRTVRLSESSMSDALQALIAWVEARPERREQIEPPGASA